MMKNPNTYQQLTGREIDDLVGVDTMSQGIGLQPAGIHLSNQCGKHRYSESANDRSIVQLTRT
jgi:hypothetical protein